MKQLITIALLLCSIAAGAQTKPDSGSLSTPSIDTNSIIHLDNIHNLGFSVIGEKHYNYTELYIASPFQFNCTTKNCYSLRVQGVFSVGLPDRKGNTLVHAHRSQLHWLNDTTAVIMPYHKPKPRKTQKGDRLIVLGEYHWSSPKGFVLKPGQSMKISIPVKLPKTNK